MSERRSGVVGYPNCTTCTDHTPCSKKTRLWQFPLCEACWRSCGSPKNELVFYRSVAQSAIRLFDTFKVSVAQFLQAVQANPKALLNAIHTLPPEQQTQVRDALAKLSV